MSPFRGISGEDPPRTARLVVRMVFEVAVVVLVLPLVAVGLSLVWSRKVAPQGFDDDAEVEAAAMLRPWR